MASLTLLGLTTTLSPTALTLLRLTPLLTTTASFTHAYMEYITTTSFLRHPPTHNALTHALAPAGGTPSSSSSSSSSPSPSTTLSQAHAQALRKATAVVLPAWFVNFFDRGVYSVLALNTGTLVSSALNLWAVGGGLRGAARTWYLAGFAGAVGHLAFVPLVSGAVAGLYGLCVGAVRGEVEGDGGKEGEEGKAEKLLGMWVGVHGLRWGSVDLVAWVCFLVGAVGVLTVEG